MHESDVTPGLANKMSLPFVERFFTTFDDTIKYVKNKAKVDLDDKPPSLCIFFPCLLLDLLGSFLPICLSLKNL